MLWVKAMRFRLRQVVALYSQGQVHNGYRSSLLPAIFRPSFALFEKFLIKKTNEQPNNEWINRN